MKSLPETPWARPFLWLTIAFVGGMVAWNLLEVRLFADALVWVIAVLFVPVFLGFSSKFSFLRHRGLPLIIFFSMGILISDLDRPETSIPPELSKFIHQPTLFYASVEAPPDFRPDRKISVPVRVLAAFPEAGSMGVRGGILLSMGTTNPNPLPLFTGDRILLRLTAKPFHNFNNPGGFDYVLYQAQRGLNAKASIPDDGWLVRAAEKKSFWDFLSKIRKKIELFRQESLFWIQAQLPPETAGIYAALLLGYTRFVSSTLQEHMSRTGVTHLLSISGLHLGLVSLAVFWLSTRLVRLCWPALLHSHDDQHIAIWPSLAAAFIYAALSGFSAPPVWRSMIMLTVCFGAACWYRHPDPLTALAAAALLILFINPNSLFEISFQLSFACMFAIFTVYPRFRRFRLSSVCSFFERTRIAGKLISPFEEAFWVSLAVNTLVLPITLYYFKGISLVGFAANIVLVPLMGFLVLPLGLCALACYPMNHSLASLILEAGSWCLAAWRAVLIRFSDFAWAYLWVGIVPPVLLLCYLAGLGIFLSPLKGNMKKISIALVISVALGSIVWRNNSPYESGPPQMVATVIDVGQGTSVLLRFPQGKSMLVDGGGFNDSSFDIGRWVLAPFLWHEKINRLDYVVLSHDHPDHRNGLRFILSFFDVGCFWESGITEIPGTESELTHIARKRAIPVRQLTELFGRHIIDECEVNVIHPSPIYYREGWDGKDINNASLVLKIDFGKTSLILPGDILHSVARSLFNKRYSSSEVLLVAPHHGSEVSNPPVLLDNLQPKAVIFSCGFENRFGFPASSVLNGCATRKIPIFRTDLQGAIEARSDGVTWTVSPADKHEKQLFSADTNLAP